MTTNAPDPAANILALILHKAGMEDGGQDEYAQLGQQAIDRAAQPAATGAAPEAGATSGTSSPVPGGTGVSGKFGEVRGEGHVHGGIDLTVPVGTSISAATSGTVTSAGNSGEGGNTVTITAPDGTVTLYMHLSGINVQPGATVTAGQAIGKSGGAAGAPGAGNSTGAHLHFEVRKGGQSVDPTPWLAGGAQIVNAEPGAIAVGTPDLAGVAGSILDKAAGKPSTYTPETPEAAAQPGMTADAGTDPDKWIRQAMAATGVDETWFAPLKARMMQESGGRNIPQGIVDVNTAKGTPAFGPMQVIQPTFEAHKMKGHEDWHNPVDNTIAAIRYILSRYGHPSKLPKGGY